ncbi:MAG: DUF488 domain-containing protein [Alphaproteobacteria bacterium]
MTKIYTIGFTQKTAEEFFAILKNSSVKKLIDIRLWPDTQLSGFAKKRDLPFFLKSLCNIGYQHAKSLAPTEEILKNYKDKIINWQEYEIQYLELLKDKNFDISLLDGVCFMCAEPTPEQCHRRLLAEYIQSKFENVEVIHL